MTLFTRLCSAPLRGKPDQRCRAPALRGYPRCRLHAGRPPKSGSPEGAAATRAGHAAYYAKRRAAKARGEPVRPNGGRPRKHLIPRHWRFALSAAQEAAVMAHMAAYDSRVRGGEPRPPWAPITSQRAEARALTAFEESFVLRLNDDAQPLAKDQVERLYALVRAAEHTLDLPGRDVRLHRLWWEWNNWRLKRAAAESVQQVAVARAAAGPGPEPQTLTTGATPGVRHTLVEEPPGDCLLHAQPALVDATEDPVETEDPHAAALRRAYEITELVVQAGLATGRRRRELGEMAAARAPVRNYPRLTIAPWLHGR